MVVRKMTLADVEAVYKISCASFSQPWSLSSIEKEVDNTVATYFVAEEEDKILGFAGLWHVLDEGEIINIAVNRDKQRCGIGNNLLTRVLKEAKIKGVKVIYLEVRLSNVAAQSLYEKHGFKQIAVRKAYYHEPVEDAVIMEYIVG